MPIPSFVNYFPKLTFSEIRIGAPLMLQGVTDYGYAYLDLFSRRSFELSINSTSTSYQIEASLSSNFTSQTPSWTFSSSPNNITIQPVFNTRTLYFRIINHDSVSDFILTGTTRFTTMSSLVYGSKVPYPTQPTYYYAQANLGCTLSIIIGPVVTPFYIDLGIGDSWDSKKLYNNVLINTGEKLVYNNPMNILGSNCYFVLYPYNDCNNSCIGSPASKIIGDDEILTRVDNYTYIIPSGYDVYSFSYRLYALTELYVRFSGHVKVNIKAGSKPTSNQDADYTLDNNNNATLLIHPTVDTSNVFFSVNGLGYSTATADVVYFKQRSVNMTNVSYNKGSFTVSLNGKQGPQPSDYYSISVPTKDLQVQVLLDNASTDTIQFTLYNSSTSVGRYPFFTSLLTNNQVYYSNTQALNGTYYVVVNVNVTSATSYTIRTQVILPPAPLSPLSIATYVITSIVLFGVFCTVLGSFVLMIVGYCLRANDRKVHEYQKRFGQDMALLIDDNDQL
jgi:hypothetical protein